MGPSPCDPDQMTLLSFPPFATHVSPPTPSRHLKADRQLSTNMRHWAPRGAAYLGLLDRDLASTPTATERPAVTAT